MMIRHLVLSILAPAILLTAGCNTGTTSDTGQKMIQPQMIATRPLCVGRFLIDVPMDAKVVWTDTRTSLTGAIKMEGPLSEMGFVSRMREEQERITNVANAKGSSFLKETQELKDHQARIFVFRDSPSNDLYYDIKVFALKTGTLFSFHDQAEDDKLPLAIRDVSRGVALLAPRDTWSIPAESGFCFDNGFLPGKDSSFEATGVQLEFSEFPNLLISFSTRSNGSPTPEGAQLLARTDAVAGSFEGADRPTVLRRTNAKSAVGRNAQEVMWKWNKSGGVMLSGNLEVYASSHHLDAPDIAFSLALDPPPQEGAPTSNEKDVLMLWDSIIESLRLRQ